VVQDAIEHRIFKSITVPKVLTLTAFILHADFLQHAPRSRITFEMWRPDTVQSQVMEAELDNRPPCFSTIPLVPVGHTDPVAQSPKIMFWCQHQANSPDEYLLSSQDNSEAVLSALLILGTLMSNPLLSHAIFVGVGHEGARRYFRRAREPLHRWRICHGKLTEHQTLGSQCRKRLHTIPFFLPGSEQRPVGDAA